MNKKYVVTILIMCVLVLGACFSPWKGDEGTVSISIGRANGGRALTTTEDEAFITTSQDCLYTIILSGGPGPQQEQKDLAYNTTVYFSTVPGWWDITVTAYLDGESYANGSRRVDIKPGPNGTITIPMALVILPEPDTYTVTFDSNDGSAVDPITGVVSGATITAPTPPTKTDFEFAGWFKEEALINEWNFAADTVTADITLYAKWEEPVIPPEPDTYTVTFDSNDGSAVDPITGVVSGARITAPTPPTKTDFEFAGWFKEEALINKWDFAADTVTANITLYARWKEQEETINTGDITFAITFDQIRDIADLVIDKEISNSDHITDRIIVTLDDSARYKSIEWRMNGITGSGPSFMVDLRNGDFGSEYVLTVEVWTTDNIPYSKKIIIYRDEFIPEE